MIPEFPSTAQAKCTPSADLAGESVAARSATSLISGSLTSTMDTHHITSGRAGLGLPRVAVATARFSYRRQYFALRETIPIADAMKPKALSWLENGCRTWSDLVRSSVRLAFRARVSIAPARPKTSWRLWNARSAPQRLDRTALEVEAEETLLCWGSTELRLAAVIGVNFELLPILSR